MHWNNGYYRHELTFSEAKGERIEQKAESLDMTVGDYLRFCINKDLDQ
jgi:hypothetical protein